MTWRESRPSGAACLFSKKMNPNKSSVPSYHTPVLLQEVLEFVRPMEGKVIVDGTLGGGGHTEAMLQAGAQVIGVDQDEQALAFAENRLKPFGDQFTAAKGNFSELAEILPQFGYMEVDAILVDIGVSSRQFDAAERGFSFSKDGPLDMRMGPSCLTTAENIINTWSESELARIFWQYGEEKASRKIAKYICEERAKKAFSRTTELADAIEKRMPRRGKRIHPATKVFQALRIEVNDELGALRKLLDTAKDILNPGGRLVVISFHSLEDRMVKRHFKAVSQKEIDRPEWPEPRANPDYTFDLLTRKPVTASAEEVSRNPRSRSAIMRAVERV